MLDTKRILQLGIGVAVGMVAYHFISKAMNGNGNGNGNGTVGAMGKVRPSRAGGLVRCPGGQICTNIPWTGESGFDCCPTAR
jgi:hypothetical protein